MNWIEKHPVICGVIVFNLILIGIVVFILINQTSKTALLDVLVTPSDSKITLNGQEVKNFETQKFAPGEYTAKIEKDGLEIKEIQLNLVENQTTKLHTYLTGSDNDFSYYVSNSNDEEILERVSDENSKDFIKKYSIIKILPIHYEKYINNYSQHVWFEITQEKNQNCHFICLKITDKTGSNEGNAYNLIKEKGFNPADYQINYKYEPMNNL